MRPANIESARRIVLSATAGAGITRCAHCNIALVQLQRTHRHLARGLMRDRGIAVERLLLNTKNTMLNLIAIGHRTATQHRRGARDIGNRRGDHTRRQRLSRRNRHAPSARALDNITRQLLVMCGNLLKRVRHTHQDLDRKDDLAAVPEVLGARDNGQDNGNGVQEARHRVDAER